MTSNMIAVLVFGLLTASAFVVTGAEVPISEVPRLMTIASPASEPSQPKTCAARPVLRFLLRLKNANEHPATHAHGYDQAEFMQAGPLEDIALGSTDSPITIIKYTSMTCSHCAAFHKTILPELKEKYIDTGKVRFILREFPLDGLAVAASTLARCAAPDRYHAIVDHLFETQSTWALPGADGKEMLLLIAKQAGFSQQTFDQCLADRELFNRIVAARQRAYDKFGVDSVPAFFVNGKRLTGEQPLKDIEAMVTGSEIAATTD